MPNGLDVAIKTCHVFHASSLREFEKELQIIPKLQHANIIKLLGCCIEGDKRILVYEYMPRGSLHNIIQGIRHLNYLQFNLNFPFLSVITIAELKAGVFLA